jgi:hypothetical protein
MLLYARQMCIVQYTQLHSSIDYQAQFGNRCRTHNSVNQIVTGSQSRTQVVYNSFWMVYNSLLIVYNGVGGGGGGKTATEEN